MLTDDEREIITEEYLRSVQRALAEALAALVRLETAIVPVLTPPAMLPPAAPGVDDGCDGCAGYNDAYNLHYGTQATTDFDYPY